MRKRLYLPEHNEPDPKITVGSVRRIHDDDLPAFVFRFQAPVHKIILDAEMRRREAWRAPAGKAFWISVVALLLSMGSLVIAVIT